MYQSPTSEIVPKKLIVPFLDKEKKHEELTEAEKMCLGLPYFCWVSELVSARLFAKMICHKLNSSSPVELDLRKNVLKELLGTCSKDVYIEPPFYCDYGANIHLGESVYMNFNCCILDVVEVRIGARTLLAPGVQIYSATHPNDPIERRSTEFGKPIKIGEDCWIGGAAIICPGYF